MRWNRELATMVAQLRRRMTRYDLVLTLLPVVLLVTLGTAGLFGLSTRAALAGWSAVGCLALVDALFLNPPTTGGRAD